ncbi:hypothetical protein FQN54_000288 [Arachnomyces sp. PD_36]|nr:hypothetical protein FQN54_000288 [Arachnomyces sp. PD_36]
MSFGAGSTWSGFGGGGNQQQGAGAGGFGAGSGFGGTANNSGFGSNSSPFGGTANNTSGGGLFGASTSGFGSGGFGANNQNQANPMFGGNRPGFGAASTSGSSMFGSNTATAGGSGFGSGGTGGFGGGSGGAFGSAGNTGSTMFGSAGNKPATPGFGGSTQGNSLFGGGGGTSAFGAAASTPAFGANAGASIGGAVPPSDGTASTPFSQYVEKDGAGSQQTTSNYQSISCMQPYQKYSFEELRTGDYAQGRRYGNASGQSGAFGTSAFGGGGFGGQQQQQNTGGFGAAAGGGGFGAASSAAPSGFGQTQTTGFGSSTPTTNPLFGASKPAGSSIFGQQASAAPAQPGAFGASTTTNNAFGSSTAGPSAFGGGGGGIFGSNNANNQQQTQNKPFGGSTFGSAFNQASTASAPFGGTAATSSPFGAPQQQQQQTQTNSIFGNNAFGQNQNQNQAKPAFGTGAFGAAANNQQQQGGSGIFGTQNNTAGGGLFNNNNQPQQQQGTGSSLFGQNNQQAGNTGGGLFANANQQQEQKPGGGLFGNSTQNAAGSFSGLGQQQNQQAGSNLFGPNNNQQQQKPGGGIFGTSSMFNQSTNNANAQNNNPFGGLNQNQQSQGPGLGNSFNASQQNQQQAPHPSTLQASILEGNPYGNQSIFSGQPPAPVQSPGPLATPLSASLRQKQRTPLPMYKITPNGANRLLTPPRRQGYGFSYSTYGTPSSASSVNSTPSGLSSSLLGGSLRGGSLGRSFGKSVSTSNLRKSFDPDNDSILAPGAFSAGSSRYSNGGSLKRLTIDRSLRTDLFTRPAALNAPALTNGTNGEEGSGQSSKLKKRVSFETDADKVNGAVVRVETDSTEPTAEELGYLRSSRMNGQVNGTGANGASASPPSATNGQPEMEQVRGNELAVVPEDGESSSKSGSKLASVPSGDPKPGEYWMRPSREELRKMPRDQLKNVSGFTVGRQSCGMVTFDKPVDLTTIDLDNIFDHLVKITVRSITVYPVDVQKPPRGKGLNVPSTLRIENSWPRGRDRKAPSPLTSGPIFDKHVNRLMMVKNTEFVDYEKETGVWVFRVPHFTTYGLDYDDDDEGESFDQSTLSAAPDTPTPKVRPQHPSPAEPSFVSGQDSTMSIDVSFEDDSVIGVEDDTFEFKKRKLVPGAFGNQEEDGIEEEDDDEDQVMGSDGSEQGSFLEDGSAGSTEVDEENFGSEIESDVGEEMDMAGSFPTPHLTAEQIMSGSPAKSRLNDTLRSTTRLMDTPPKARLDLSGDWTEQLQRTISPRKQDRAALREVQANAVVGRSENDTPRVTNDSDTGADKGFATSIDLMNSLFRRPGDQAQPLAKKSQQQDGKAKGKGFEWPYSKTPKTFAGQEDDDEDGMDENEAAFHDSFKPRWGPRATLICPTADVRDSVHGTDQPWEEGMSIVSEGRSVSLLKFGAKDESSEILNEQRAQTEIRLVDNVPFARLTKTRFHRYAELTHGSGKQTDMERRVWLLAHMLFNDTLEDDISAGIPAKHRRKFNHRIKKDRLTRVWEEIIREQHGKDIDTIESPEERAIAYLCSHRIDEACKTLVESGNLHLATLIPQIGRDGTTKADMAAQIASWRKHNVYSEMSEPIRALYELLAGNAVRSEGKPGGPLEDRASTFDISERFGLDWIQAFGLRLWYGITENEPIEAAVAKFHKDLLEGGEPAYPYPWHVNGEKQAELDEGQGSSGRLESPLWVVLKIYAAAMAPPRTKLLQPISLPGAIMPEAMAGNGLSNRLSFLLHHSIYAIVGQHHAVEVDTTRADQLAWDYAWELTSTNQFHLAIFVLMHLSRPSCRERSIKEVLARFAAEIPTPFAEDGSPNKLWTYLTDDLRLPEAWLWVAKALHARDTGDAANEVNFLIRGKNWNEAHTTFCRVVGPSAVIERDYDTLRTLIQGFGDNPDRKVREWATGGAVYEDFLRLVPTRGRKPQDRASLKRLVDVLVSLGEELEKDTSATGQGLEKRVAFREMGRVVAGWCIREDGSSVEPGAVLRLPLTQDARVLHTAEMSRRYYALVMAGGY